MTGGQPRTREQRKVDTLAAPTADIWVATAAVDAGGHASSYLVPLSLAWIDERVVLATEAGSVTAGNITSQGGVRLGLGPTRDVVMIDAELNRISRPVSGSGQVSSSHLAVSWANGGRLEGCPRVKRALPTLSGGCCSGSRGWPCRGRPVGLAVPAGVGFGDGEAEGFEFGDEFAKAAVVVEPGAVVGELLVRQDTG